MLLGACIPSYRMNGVHSRMRNTAEGARALDGRLPQIYTDRHWNSNVSKGRVGVQRYLLEKPAGSVSELLCCRFTCRSKPSDIANAIVLTLETDEPGFELVGGD